MAIKKQILGRQAIMSILVTVANNLLGMSLGAYQLPQAIILRKGRRHSTNKVC